MASGLLLPLREDQLDRLLRIMATLRDPERGCPWDLQQNFKTIAPYTVEEAYEVADAIERGRAYLDALRTGGELRPLAGHEVALESVDGRELVEANEVTVVAADDRVRGDRPLHPAGVAFRLARDGGEEQLTDVFIGLVVYRQLRGRQIAEALSGSLTDIGSVIFLIALSAIFSYGIVLERIPDAIAATITGITDNLPPALIPTMVELGARSQGNVARIAVVVDVRGRRFFDKPWVDAALRPGKASGAFAQRRSVCGAYCRTEGGKERSAGKCPD